MPGDPSQQDRLFSFSSPLGADKLIVRKFRGREAISDLFHHELELASADHKIDPNQIIGRRVTLGIRRSDGASFRYFDGFVSRFHRLPHGGGPYAHYFCEMRPRLWFSTLRSDCFIYQEKPLRDVIEDRLRELDITDFEFRLYEPHGAWEYCIQYRESTYDFLSRLAEVEGIYFFFKHDNGKHSIIFADNKSANEPCPGRSNFKYESVFGPGVLRSEDVIFDWRPRKSVVPGKYTQEEYNFTDPRGNLKSEMEGVPPGSSDKYEVYDYPGEYETRSDGQDYVKIRQQELEVDHHVAEGRSNSRDLHAGYKFTLRDHEVADENGEYLLSEVIHEGREGPLFFGDDSKSADYENTFRCVPAAVQYRPKRKTPKHVMRGMQSAKVVGPAGEEIYTDEYGRVKVKFFWDRERPKDQHHEGASCWMRVMQSWTGANWGHIWIPRVGQEVVVDFFEGDPDRPVIIGCLYNADNMPPYGLPGKKTRAGVKTRSTKSGGPADFNELRLDDDKGEELFLMHAQKDMDVSVENDLCEKVERDHHREVHRDQMELVKGDKHSEVQGARNEKTGGDLSIEVQGKHQETAMQDILIESKGGQIHLKAGMRVILDAPMGVTLLGGGSYIDLSPAGVSIQGALVNINSGVPHKGPGSPAAPKSAKGPKLPKMPRE